MAADAQSQGLSHDNRALPGLPIFVFLMAFLACIVVGLRLYVRVWLKSVAGSDDLLICPALVSLLTCCEKDAMANEQSCRLSP